MAQVAESPVGREYKELALAALDVRPGQTVLDVGCGPGTDLPALGQAVTATGSVIGVDFGSLMLEEATRRVADTPWVEVRRGDAHALPLEDQSVDRVRTDRVLQHVAFPTAVFAEIYRVLRPGGIAVLAEPDRSTLVAGPGDPETNRAFNDFVCAERIRNPTIGRQLAGLARDAELEVLNVDAVTPACGDFELANKIYGLRSNTARAIKAGDIDRAQGERWLTDLSSAGGAFSSISTLFIAVLRRPARLQDRDTG
jgi:ubiquinone/menaquinone biosynthesis C-methylase UbiE